jgi:hypothetical protein
MFVNTIPGGSADYAVSGWPGWLEVFETSNGPAIAAYMDAYLTALT